MSEERSTMYVVQDGGETGYMPGDVVNARVAGVVNARKGKAGPLMTGHDCAYCGAFLTPDVEQVCREQGGDAPGTWMCSEGAG